MPAVGSESIILYTFYPGGSRNFPRELETKAIGRDWELWGICIYTGTTEVAALDPAHW